MHWWNWHSPPAASKPVCFFDIIWGISAVSLRSYWEPSYFLGCHLGISLGKMEAGRRTKGRCRHCQQMPKHFSFAKSVKWYLNGHCRPLWLLLGLPSFYSLGFRFAEFADQERKLKPLSSGWTRCPTGSHPDQWYFSKNDNYPSFKPKHLYTITSASTIIYTDCDSRFINTIAYLTAFNDFMHTSYKLALSRLFGLIFHKGASNRF